MSTHVWSDLPRPTYPPLSRRRDPSASAAHHKEAEEKAKDGEGGAGKTGYEYLLGMNLWSLTQEKVAEIFRGPSGAACAKRGFIGQM